MVMGSTRNGSLPVYATREELLQAAKAINDEFRKSLTGLSYRKDIEGEVKSLVDSKLNDVETDLALRLGKSIGRETDDRLKILETDFSVRVGKSLALDYDTKIKALDDNFNKRLEVEVSKRLQEIEEGHNKRLETLQKSYEEKMGFIQSAYESGMKQIASLLEKLSIPAPSIINQIPPAIPADVIVNIPEQPAPILNLPAAIPADVIVNIPEQSKLQPIFQVPENPPAIIQIPQARLVKKFIEYDEVGRPHTITETEGE